MLAGGSAWAQAPTFHHLAGACSALSKGLESTVERVEGPLLIEQLKLRGSADLRTAEVVTDFLAGCLSGSNYTMGHAIGASPSPERDSATTISKARRRGMGAVVTGTLSKGVGTYTLALQGTFTAEEKSLPFPGTIDAAVLDAFVDEVRPPLAEVVLISAVPGLGLWTYQDEPVWGGALMATWVGLASTTAVFWMRGADEQAQYDIGVRETVPARRRAETEYGRRDLFLGLTIGVMAVSFIQSLYAARYQPARASVTPFPGIDDLDARGVQ